MYPNSEFRNPSPEEHVHLQYAHKNPYGSQPPLPSPSFTLILISPFALPRLLKMSSAPSHTPPKKDGPVEAEGFFPDLFNSIFSPAYNTVPQKIMNFSFYGLFFVLFVLIFLTNYNPHVIALLTLAVGLWMSVNW